MIENEQVANICDQFAHRRREVVLLMLECCRRLCDVDSCDRILLLGRSRDS